MQVDDSHRGHQTPVTLWSDPLASQTVSEGVAQVKWRAKVPAARQRWVRCSESELLRCNGDRLLLAGLIQRRYGLTGAAAAQDVQGFLDLRHTR